MRHLLLPALCAWLVFASPALGEIDRTWVGGAELPGRYLFFVAHLDSVSPTAGGVLHFADGEESVIRLESAAPDDVRFVLPGEGASYVFVGSVGADELTGDLFPEGSEGTRFPFRLVPIERATPDALKRYEGTYQFRDGDTWTIRAVEPGFLRAYDRRGGTFHNLYPEAPRQFFRGPGLDRPSPREADIEFETGELHDSRRGRGLQIEERTTPLSWSVAGNRAVLRFASVAPFELVRVDPGTFAMGDPVDAGEAEAIFGLSEGSFRGIQYPPRETELTASYWLGATEVTNGWFRAFVDEEAYVTTAELQGWGLLWNGEGFDRVAAACWRDPGREIDPEEPVAMVGWHDAIEFCRWLSHRAGRDFRLPTEAEWEYASRAGGDGLYGFGRDPAQLAEYAWYRENAAGKPHLVGSRMPNAWGLHDMHGNVWEWCADWFEEFDRSAVVSDPVGPSAGEGRVIRGGSWINGAIDCRSGYRAHDDPDLVEPHFGFRICLTGAAADSAP